ncbi:LytS family sensor histidine kinase [Chitinophaga dinghuensis]|nr:histidine kinase [Chitinophaga dinghuensis]
MKSHREPYRYFIHAAIWMALVLLYSYPSFRGSMNNAYSLRYVLVRNVLYGFINFNLFYLLAFWLLDKPIRQRKYLLSTIAGLAAVLLFCILKYEIGFLWFKDVILQKMMMVRSMKPGSPPLPPPYFKFTEFFRTTFRTSIGVALLALGYRLFLNSRNSDDADLQLQSDVMRATRKYERMQSGSRLLLQHLQALTPVLEKEATRSEEGVQAILILSDLLRYMLYDKAAEEGKADLKKELFYFQQYIFLRKYLYPKQKVILEVNGREEGWKVEPLLLQASTEERLQDLQQYEGEIRVTVNITDTLELDVDPINKPERHLHKAKLYCEHV